MEHAKNDNIFLTITFPKGRLGIKPERQFWASINTIATLLSRSCETYDINPELQLNGCIHYHCIIQLKDKVKWYKQTLPSLKRLGFIDVQYVKHRQECKDYCRKDREMMERILLISLPVTETDKEYINKSLVRGEAEFGLFTEHLKPVGICKSLLSESIESQIQEMEQNVKSMKLHLKYKNKYTLNLFE